MIFYKLSIRSWHNPICISPKKNLKSSFPLRFPPSLKSFGRAGKARRAEGGCGGNSARRPARRSFNAGGAQPVPFGYFQTDTDDNKNHPAPGGMIFVVIGTFWLKYELFLTK